MLDKITLKCDSGLLQGGMIKPAILIILMVKDKAIAVFHTVFPRSGACLLKQDISSPPVCHIAFRCPPVHLKSQNLSMEESNDPE